MCHVPDDDGQLVGHVVAAQFLPTEGGVIILRVDAVTAGDDIFLSDAGILQGGDDRMDGGVVLLGGFVHGLGGGGYTH